MQHFPQTYIIRHRRENLKKCSLRGLEQQSSLSFLTYPKDPLPPIEKGYCLLSLEGAELQKQDAHLGLVLLDATWRWAEKMDQWVEGHLPQIEKRRLPKGYLTAYPRRQEDCAEPKYGLASVEALYIAYHILGRPNESFLSNYYWKQAFLEKNCALLGERGEEHD